MLQLETPLCLLAEYLHSYVHRYIILIDERGKKLF